MEIQLKNVMCAYLVTIPKIKIPQLVKNALWDILQDKTIPRGSFCDTIDVNRALEARLVLQPKPPICWKVATIAPVVRIPMWKLLVMPANVKDVQKEDGAVLLASQKSRPVSIVILEGMALLVEEASFHSVLVNKLCRPCATTNATS